MQSESSGLSYRPVRSLQDNSQRLLAVQKGDPPPQPNTGGEPTRKIPSKFRVLIVGRDRMSGDLLASALNQTDSCEAAAVAPEGLSEALAARKIHLAVISAELDQRRSGFDLTAGSIRAFPNLIVVILLSQVSQTSVVNAFRAGARGVFSRERPIQEFLDCIEHVRRGYLWAGPYEADALLHVFRHLPAPSISMAANATPLTDRETQVVQCAATGKTNRQIAQALHLSENTVKNYLFKS
ncbi:MAG TPA: response regulator transcription factor, partial [Acidobacteriaceae bacterium]|nr:response regulator transcription factor [Acidobacteriaceae bacterium]